MAEQIKPEQWKEIEGSVNKAEKDKRKAAKSSREIRKETGLTHEERGLPFTREEILGGSKRKRVAEKALDREEELEKEAEDLLGLENSPERALVGLRKANLIKALKDESKLEDQRQELLDEESDILRTVEQEPSGSELEALQDIRKKVTELNSEKKELSKSSPEAYFGLHLKELKEYKEQLQTGRIVETPYVKRQIEDILAHFRANKPVMIYGHLGTGKTELAMHVARKYLDKEALVISGSKHTSLAELYGHQVLTIDTGQKEDLDLFIAEVEQKFKNWEKNNDGLNYGSTKASEEDKNRAHDRILQTYLTQFKSGTISDFFLGPIYRAMAEGKPVIIDEINAIPHEVLISLNHILTRRVGDEINIQQDSGRKVKVEEDFGIMATGNINQGQDVYKDREDMDPAFLSRLHKIEYDYLPQKTEGSLEDEVGPENELFQLIIAKMMDRNGNIEAPKDSRRKLWNLAKAARISQDVFAGREISNAYYFQQAAGRSARYVLKESVLSIRALDNIINQWQKDGYKRELDYYIWQEFVSQSTVASDRAYLYQLLKDRFGFFKSQDWEQNPNYGSGGVINSFIIQPPQNSPDQMEFLGPREVVEMAFGKAPERTKWPEVKAAVLEKEESSFINLEKIQSLSDFFNSFKQELGSLGAEVDAYCLIPEAGQESKSQAKKKKRRFSFT